MTLPFGNQLNHSQLMPCDESIFCGSPAPGVAVVGSSVKIPPSELCRPGLRLKSFHSHDSNRNRAKIHRHVRSAGYSGSVVLTRCDGTGAGVFATKPFHVWGIYWTNQRDSFKYSSRSPSVKPLCSNERAANKPRRSRKRTVMATTDDLHAMLVQA